MLSFRDDSTKTQPPRIYADVTPLANPSPPPAIVRLRCIKVYRLFCQRLSILASNMRLKGLWSAIAHASAKADGILAEHAASAFGDTNPDGSSAQKDAPVTAVSDRGGGSAASTKGSSPKSPKKASSARSPERTGGAAPASPVKSNKGGFGCWRGLIRHRKNQLFLGPPVSKRNRFGVF